MTEGFKIRFTIHAEKKIKQRNISKVEIRKIILKPESVKVDKLDHSLYHYIGRSGNKYLIVLRPLDKKEFLVITCFYDRRIKRRLKNA